MEIELKEARERIEQLECLLKQNGIHQIETTREIALRTYKKYSGSENVMYWHIWKLAFDIAFMEFKKIIR